MCEENKVLLLTTLARFRFDFHYRNRNHTLTYRECDWLTEQTWRIWLVHGLLMVAVVEVKSEPHNISSHETIDHILLDTAVVLKSILNHTLASSWKEVIHGHNMHKQQSLPTLDI
jgi:hypothetical protein